MRIAASVFRQGWKYMRFLLLFFRFRCWSSRYNGINVEQMMVQNDAKDGDSAGARIATLSRPSWWALADAMPHKTMFILGMNIRDESTWNENGYVDDGTALAMEQLHMYHVHFAFVGQKIPKCWGGCFMSCCCCFCCFFFKKKYVLLLTVVALRGLHCRRDTVISIKIHRQYPHRARVWRLQKNTEKIICELSGEKFITSCIWSSDINIFPVIFLLFLTQSRA